MQAAQQTSEPRHPRKLRLAVKCAIACAVMVACYVPNYWVLHWLRYRSDVTSTGIGWYLSKAYRTPGDLYAESSWPGSRQFDHWKREWQRSGRRAYERARAEERAAERREDLQSLAPQRADERDEPYIDHQRIWFVTRRSPRPSLREGRATQRTDSSEDR